MLRPLLPHQQRMLDYANPRDEIALFVEMRLGKTLVAIRWAQPRIAEAATGGALVVAPITTLKGWERELHLEGERRVIWLTQLDEYERTCRASAPERWYLINYEALRVWKAGPSIPWSVIILDESTRIKNPQAKITKVLLNKYDSVYRAILTGMPNPEGPMNYFTQMQFVNRGSFMGFRNFWGWRDKLFMQVGYDWIPRRGKDDRPGTRERIKDEVNRLACVMTRKEANVGSRLVTEIRTVQMNDEQRRAFKQVKKKFKFGDLETKFAGTQHVWLQRIAGGFSPDRDDPHVISDAKTKEIIELLGSELKDEPVVIWFHFNEELAYVYHTLKAKGFKVSAILGPTPLEKRYQRQRKFQKGRVQVLCMQEKLGMFGLDLSRADTEIYYSNAWGYEERTQSQDRLVHPLKTAPLLAIDLVTEGTTDEDVVETLQEKGLDAKSFQSKLLDRIRRRLG